MFRLKRQLPHRWHMILIATFLVAPHQVHAQTTGQEPGKSDSSAQDATQKSDSSGTEPASPVGLSWANTYISQIGTSGLLAGNRQGVGWGSLYVPSASVSGLLERFGGTTASSGADLDAAILQTSVVFDHRVGRSRLAIQYAPSLAIANGQVIGNFSNQNATFDLIVYARPRWSVRFGDSFNYDYNQQILGPGYFDINPATGGTATNSFLRGPRSWLTNSATVSIAYALSKRSSISIMPQYIFSQSGSGSTGSHAGLYGGTANWNYLLNERQSVGVQYTGQLIHETFPGTSPSSPGSTSDTLYHTVAVTTARQLRATWIVRGAVGATTSWFTQKGQSTSTQQWSFYGGLGLVKQMGHASLGVNYSRGESLSNGLISSGYADRLDMMLQDQLTKRLNWRVGGGYLRQAQFGNFSGWYSSGDAQFLLAPRAAIYCFFDYTHNYQSSNSNSLFAGHSDTYSFGMRWQPSSLTR